MQFKLAYKSYDYKPTWNAFRSFQEDTGESMLGLLYGYVGIWQQLEDHNQCEAVSKVLNYCPEILGSKIFYYLAKECNSHLTLEEIQDAVFHTSGEIPKESDSMANPWYLILVSVASDVIKVMTDNALKKKPNPNS